MGDRGNLMGILLKTPTRLLRRSLRSLLAMTVRSNYYNFDLNLLIIYMKKISFSQMDGSNLRIGIVVARWNSAITKKLLDGCIQALEHSQVKKDNITIVEVPGSFELPFAAKQLANKNDIDVVVCIGLLIKGETVHFEYISEAVSKGIMDINTLADTPVIFGVLTCLTEEQAIARSTGENNHGYGWGKSAVEMGLLKF